MEELDLNIDNYELNDLLNLFQLDYDFDESGLKQAKKIVLQTHPDKCKLDKEYFLFFSAAYKIIFSIYSFRNNCILSKKEQQRINTDYANIIYKEEDNNEGKELLLQGLKDKANFNKIFNELFEKYKIDDEDTKTGYAEFMQSDEGMDDRTTTMATMNETFERKKNELKAIVPVRNVSEMYASDGFGTDLTNGKPESYSSGLFSSLQYEDLRKAHIETVIPVTHNDYLNRQKFKNVDEFRRDENYNDVKPPSMTQSAEYLKQRDLLLSKTDVSRAYKLAKQEEISRKANEGFLNEFQRLCL